jgi:pentatricopeptide repeat protein
MGILKANISDVFAANELLIEMEAQNMKPNISIYNSFLNVHCSKKESFEMAISLYQNVKDNNITIVKTTLDLMIRACALVQDYDQGTMFYKEFLKMKFIPTHRTYTPMLQLYLAHNLSEGEEFFEKLKTYDTEMLAYCSVMLSHYMKMGDTKKCESVWKYMEENGLEKDMLLFFHVIRQQISAGDIEGALNVLEQMDSKNIVPDGHFKNVVISELCKAKLFKDALNFFKYFLKQSKPPTGLFCTLIREFSNEKMKDELYFIFETALKKNARLTVDDYNIVLEFTARQRDMRTLLEYWKVLLESSFVDPNGKSYSIMLEANLYSNNFPFAETMLKKMIEANYDPTGEQYIAMIKLAISQRLYSNASNIIESVRKSSLSKNVSLSDAFKSHSSAFEKLIVQKFNECGDDPAAAYIESSGTEKWQKRIAKPNVEVQVDKEKNIKLLILLYKEVILSGSIPKQVTFRAVMNAHLWNCDLVGVVQVWQTLVDNHGPDMESVSLLLQSSLELGETNIAKAILNMISKKKYELGRSGHEYLILMTCKWNPNEVKYLLLDYLNAGFVLTPDFYERMMAIIEDPKFLSKEKEGLLAFIDEQIPEFSNKFEEEDKEFEIITSKEIVVE